MPCWHVNTWKLRHPSFELCRNSSPCYTTHVSQPILNQRPKTHYKFQIQKISSHTSLVSTHVCQPILNQCPKTHYKIQSENVHLTHPYFELCRNNPEQITPCMWANPSWTNVPKHTTNFRSENFHLTHPCFPRMCANPSWTNVPRHTTNFNPKIFISHIPVWTLPEQITPHICASPEPMLHRHTTKSQTLRVSSHTSLFWTLPEQLHITPHMWANPSWTKVPRHPTNFIRKCSSHTSLFWTLPEQPGTDYTTHVSQPILNQRPKTHYKLQIRICSSHTSLFWTLPEQLAMLHHACEPTHPVPTSQDTA